MKRHGRYILLCGLLLALSAGCYVLHYLFFRDVHHIFIYLVGDVAFVFVEVLLVTLIIHRVLEDREKRARMEKLHMVIGAFFSEAGMKLLAIMSAWDPAVEVIQRELAAGETTAEQKFDTVRARLQSHDVRLETGAVDWERVGSLLVSRREFLLRLLENPNILEHEAFTDLLWAVFHLTEELEVREDLRDLPETDRRHLAGDATRVYGRLVRRWLAHMEHLKNNYPYLFSLSVRINPFDRGASPVVREV